MAERRLALVCGLLALGLAHGACDCKTGLPSLAIERLALPAVYDTVFGLVPVHTREYWLRHAAALAKLDPVDFTPAQFDDLVAADAGLGRDEQALVLLRAHRPTQVVAIARCLTRLNKPKEAVGVLEPLKDPPVAVEYALAAARFLSDQSRTRRAAHPSCLLGFEFAEKLDATFRTSAPGPGTNGADRAVFERATWDKLGLRGDPYEALLPLFALQRGEWAEPYFALAELLSVAGYRRLAWHAYQRAWDLDHPRAEEFTAAQQQVALGLPEPERFDLTPARHARLRRAALAWTDAWQAFERRTLAAGGDPDDPDLLARFYKEHPKP